MARTPDVSGPRDDPEHAADPECLDVRIEDDDEDDDEDDEDDDGSGPSGGGSSGPG